MMYVTGDCHADWRKFNKECFPEGTNLTRDDYILVLGDFGIWDNSKREKWWFDWMEEKNFTILFVDGNHENFDILNNFPVSKWKGGNVHFVRKNIIHLMRGQIFDIDGYKFFTFGGANSHDIEDGILEIDDPNLKSKKKSLAKLNKYRYRINHESWWKEEMPSKEEMILGKDNLFKNNNEINFIVSHDCPSIVLNKLDSCSNDYKSDKLNEYFDEIANNNKFDIWLFGHHHENKKIDNKYICLYEQIIKLY